jgi:hypothetical protein
VFMPQMVRKSVIENGKILQICPIVGIVLRVNRTRQHPQRADLNLGTVRNRPIGQHWAKKEEDGSLELPIKPLTPRSYVSEAEPSRPVSLRSSNSPAKSSDTGSSTCG